MTRKTGRSHRLKLYARGNTHCPLCFTPFTKAEASSGRTVTLEHVPPKALGGKALCLTCRSCNASAGRGIDQLAAMGARSRFPVTVDILGKKDTFMLAREGKELTPPFRGFTKGDFDRLRRAGGRFTMSLAVANPHLVAVSAIKSAYLALFSLFGPTGAYDYVGGRALADVRRLLLDPGDHAEKEAGKYAQFVPNAERLAPEGRPEPDILLVTEPHACWIVRVGDHNVYLPLEGNGNESAPLSDWYIRKLGGSGAQLRVSEAWTFQQFGALRTVSVHLAGAERWVESLVGREIGGNLPDGKPLKGVCVSLVGESAVLLCSS
ncbi:MAG: hypothetical protein OXQ89_21150 [Rhodospirillaceae bacterium]|nr:hypothetical protein [Rhodospirillaceae bacterium]